MKSLNTYLELISNYPLFTIDNLLVYKDNKDFQLFSITIPKNLVEYKQSDYQVLIAIKRIPKVDIFETAREFILSENFPYKLEQAYVDSNYKAVVQLDNIRVCLYDDEKQYRDVYTWYNILADYNGTAYGMFVRNDRIDNFDTAKNLMLFNFMNNAKKGDKISFEIL